MKEALNLIERENGQSKSSALMKGFKAVSKFRLSTEIRFLHQNWPVFSKSIGPFSVLANVPIIQCPITLPLLNSSRIINFVPFNAITIESLHFPQVALLQTSSFIQTERFFFDDLHCYINSVWLNFTSFWRFFLIRVRRNFSRWTLYYWQFDDRIWRLLCKDKLTLYASKL